MSKSNTVTLTIEVECEDEEALKLCLYSANRSLYHMISGQATYLGEEKPFIKLLFEQGEYKMSYKPHNQTGDNNEET